MEMWAGSHRFAHGHGLAGEQCVWSKAGLATRGHRGSAHRDHLSCVSSAVMRSFLPPARSGPPFSVLGCGQPLRDPLRIQWVTRAHRETYRRFIRKFDVRFVGLV
jgi:hypothetical protein